MLRDLERQYPFLHVVSHRRQRGIADSLRSAGDVARGDVFVFYPADLQYLPADIPALVRPILDGRADIVTGTKQGKYEKAFVSNIYNGLSRGLFNVPVRDLNNVYLEPLKAVFPATRLGPAVGDVAIAVQRHEALVKMDTDNGTGAVVNMLTTLAEKLGVTDA